MHLKVRATAVLIEDGNILLVEQKIGASVQRAWSLPGGTLEPGETLEACLLREMQEETGLHVAIERLLYVCDRIADGRHVVHITFAVKRTGGYLCTGSEPEPSANPIHSARTVPLTALSEYGFNERFITLAMQGFPNAGTYQGTVENIGL